MYEARQYKKEAKDKVSRQVNCGTRQLVQIRDERKNAIIQKSKGEVFGGVIGGIAGTAVGGITGTVVGGLGLGTAIGGGMGLTGGIIGGIQLGRTIEHQIWKRRNAPFTVANILYASMRHSNVGSIYFPTGRIRLTHKHGPSVSIHLGVQRYTISNADYAAHHIQRGMRLFSVRLCCPSFQPAAIGGGGRLLESFHGRSINHISRGGPVAFNYGINQQQLNLIYHAAQTGSNRRLRIAMNSDPVTRGIPMQ